MEVLDAAAVEAALSLCEEAVSEGHTLPGPWETQELKPSDPTPTVPDSNSAQEPQGGGTELTLTSDNTESQNLFDAKTEEQNKGSGEGAEGTGSDEVSSVVSDDGATGREIPEGGAAVKEAAEATVKCEGEEWSQPEPNPPCLGEYPTRV